MKITRFFIPVVLYSALCITAGTSCHTEEEPQALFPGFVVPASFPQPVYLSSTNLITEDGFQLGRRLFYDPVLSKDGTISCGTCHAQLHGFADHSIAFSIGIYGRTGTRNAPSLSNLAWHPAFMWDGGINHIEVMPIAPLTDSVEMGETLLNIIAKLNQHPDYPALFEKAFGSPQITDQRILYAFAQFMAMMISADSRYDQYMKGTTTFTANEEAGLNIFRQKCASCHPEPLFTDFSYRSNGLDITPADPGRERITQNMADHGKFKVPSLRNVSLTYPYMHDGRFFSLNQVLDHYASGIQPAANLDPLLAQGIPLNAEEKIQLLAFLKTLRDDTFLSNPLFSEPLMP